MCVNRGKVSYWPELDKEKRATGNLIEMRKVSLMKPSKFMLKNNQKGLEI